MAFKKGGKASAGTGPGSLKLRRFAERAESTGFPWHRVSAPLIAATLDCGTAHGVAIMFGSAAGGRGVVVTFFADGDRGKEYASTVGEFHELMVAIVEEYQGQSEDYFAAYGIDLETLENV